MQSKEYKWYFRVVSGERGKKIVSDALLHTKGFKKYQKLF